MQRKSELPPQAFSTESLNKSGHWFSKLQLSEQETGPLTLGQTTSRTTEKNLNSILNAPVGPQKDIPHRPHWYRKSKRFIRKHRIAVSIVSAFLLLLIVGGIAVTIFVQSLLNSNTLLAAPPTIQISIDAQALHTLIAQGLNTSQDSISNVNIVPLANNGLKIGLTMVISGSGINRNLPLEIDSTLGGSLQPHQNILTIQHFIRDGVDAGPQAAASMQATINQLLEKTLPLPGTNNPLAIAALLNTSGAIQQSDSRVCGRGSILLHLGLPIQLHPGFVLPVTVDSYIGLDQKNNLQFHLDSITYNNGNGIGNAATNAARYFINQMLSQSSSPSSASSGSSSGSSSNVDKQINQIKFLSLRTSSQSVCGKNTEMLVLQLGPQPGK